MDGAHSSSFLNLQPLDYTFFFMPSACQPSKQCLSGQDDVSVWHHAAAAEQLNPFPVQETFEGKGITSTPSWLAKNPTFGKSDTPSVLINSSREAGP